MTKREQAQSLVQLAHTNLQAAKTFAITANIFGLFFDALPADLRSQLDENLL